MLKLIENKNTVQYDYEKPSKIIIKKNVNGTSYVYWRNVIGDTKIGNKLKMMFILQYALKDVESIPVEIKIGEVRISDSMYLTELVFDFTNEFVQNTADYILHIFEKKYRHALSKNFEVSICKNQFPQLRRIQ